ncbi:MAG: four helix bundle protein [Ignavibacteriales bacterium]|nr:four helix bundle protein [Ignavibacteriales bacterium]
METSGYSFEDLEVYKSAREFRKKIYLLLAKLPADEKYNLQSQMRRASLSLTNNIAEGHGRFHYQENIQYLRQTRGSLEEFIDNLKKEAYELLKRINGYISYLKKRKDDN